MSNKMNMCFLPGNLSPSIPFHHGVSPIKWSHSSSVMKGFHHLLIWFFLTIATIIMVLITLIKIHCQVLC